MRPAPALVGKRQSRSSSRIRRERDALSVTSYRRLLLEPLEERRMLSVMPFATFANDLESKLTTIQNTLDTALDTVASLKSLPFIGRQLGEAAQVKAVVDNVGSQIQSVLDSFSMVGATQSDLQNVIFQALGPSGLNLLGGDSDGANNSSTAADVHVSNFQLYASGLLKTADVELRLHEDASTNSPANLAFTLGLPSLPIQITSTGGIDLTVGFDFELAIDFNAASGTPLNIDSSKIVDDFSPSLSSNQLVFSVTATLASNASLTADLGLLTGTLVPTPSQTNSLTAEIDVNGLQLSGSPTIAFGGNADLNLTATLGLGDGGANFPSISTDLVMSWSDLTDPSTLSFSYDNLSLNLGQFLSNLVGPIVNDIQQYTAPIRSLINILNTPIPGIDQIPGLGNFSLLSLLSALGDGNGLGSVASVLSTVSTIVTDIDSLSIGPNVSLPFGDFALDGTKITGSGAPADADDLTNVLDLLGSSPLSDISISDLTGTAQNAVSSFNLNNAVSPLGLSPSATSTLSTLNSNASIGFPLLDNPASLLNLLFGQDVDLVTFNASVTASSGPINIFSASIPVFWPFSITVGLSADFGLGASLGIGYDTYGLREALAQLQSGHPTAGQLASDIGDGFYISQPDTNVTFSAGLSAFAGVGIDILIASASVGLSGGVTANVQVSLNPSAAVDGKIRLLELEQDFNTSLFDVSGSITAGLSLVFEWRINYLFGHTGGNDTIYNFGTVTLWSFNTASSYSAPPAIAGITPDSGPTAGGNQVVIFGSNLSGASAVDFGGIPVTIDNDQPGFILVTVPPDSAGPVNVEVTTGGGSTTDAGGYTYAAAPRVTSIATGAFTPAGGPEAGGTDVTITGTDLQNASAVDFGSAGAGPIVSDSATQIVAISPAGSGTVDVTVVTPGGTSATSSADHFIYVPPPVITSIVNSEGPEPGGNYVTIFGSNLGSGAYVNFGGYMATRSAIRLDTASEIRVLVPAATNPGTVDVLVDATGGLSAVNEPADEYTYVPPPVVAYVTPNSGPITGKTGIEITGYHFGGATAVDFELQAGTITSLYEIDPAIDLWTMIATAPPAAMYGLAQVRVTTAGGTSSTTSYLDPYYDIYFYTAPPSVTTVSPSIGPLAGGTSVTITGANLGGAQGVEFGGVPATSFTYNSTTGTITAVSPAESAGTVPVTVITPGGATPVSVDDDFTYTPAPAVTAVTPNAGAYEGGTAVTIVGTNFSGATAVDFDGVPATGVDVVSSTEIVATSPAGALGPVDVTVTTPEGPSTPSPADQFTYNDEPVVTGISPLTGQLPGGDSVLITGLNFTGATDVYFGGVDVPVTAGEINGAGTTITVNSANTFDMVDAQTNSGDMVLNGPISYSYSAGEWTFVLQAQNTGSQTYNDVDFVPQFLWDTATTPNPALAWDNVGQDWTGNGDTFSIASYDVGAGPTPPVYLPLAQTNTPTSWGGNSMQALATIASSASCPAIPLGNFGPGATENFTLVCPANNFDPAVVGFFVEPQPGTVDVTVSTPVRGVSRTSAPDRFTFGSGPMVSGVAAATGPAAGGTPVTISGANFTGATDVYFGGVDVPVIAGMVNAGGTAITLSSPAGAAGSVDITVVTPNGTSTTSSADTFSYYNVPTIATLSSTIGPAVGSTPITITGVGLANATAVDFGANPATIVSDTDSQIVVLTPAGSNTVNVTVTTPHGTSAAESFGYLVRPAVTSISRTDGPASGGTTTIISGSGFSDVLGVDFGGIPARSFVVNLNGTITAVSPAGDVSIVDVQVITGGGESIASPADQFTYVPNPIVATIGTTEASFAGGQSLAISGSGLGNATEVYVGNLEASILSDTDDQIVVSLPASAGAATLDVTVVTDGGISATTPDDQLTYVAAPAVASISPASGFLSGGDLVTISGTNLDDATEVDFGQTAGTIVDESADAIDVISPSGVVGAANITVVTPGGTSPVNPQVQFSYSTPLPTVDGLSQTVGPAAGGTTITITGTNLTGVTAVDFGSTPATIVSGSNTDTQITVISPVISAGGTGSTGAADATVDVTVITAGGTSATSMLDQYTGVLPPAVSSVSSRTDISNAALGTVAAAGPLSGGSEVLIAGTDLGGASAVNFGGAAGTILVDGDSYIIAQSPAGAAGAVDIAVTTPYGTSSVSPADQFSYVAAPSATADSYTAAPNSTLVVGASTGVLANDSDPQGLPLTATLLTQPADGTLAFNSDGSFTYTPDAGYLGSDSFTYQASNGVTTSAATTVSITVAPAALTWSGSTTGAGNWTDSTWTGVGPAYPDATVSTTIGAGGVVDISSNQAAYSLAVQSGGQAAVGPGAVLSVTTDTSVTGKAALSIDPAGLLSVGGTLTLDTGGSVAGGPVSAGSYQFNDGTASADLGGSGGATIGGGKAAGTVTLSGTNTYGGATMVLSGTLVVGNSYSLPDSSTLIVGDAAAFGGTAGAAAAVVPAIAPAVAGPMSVASQASQPAAPQNDQVESPFNGSAQVGSLPVAPNPRISPAILSPAALSPAAHDAVLRSRAARAATEAGDMVWLWNLSAANGAHRAGGADLAASAVDRWLAAGY